MRRTYSSGVAGVDRDVHRDRESPFSCFADTRKGNRPSFTDAAPPEEAEPLVRQFVGALRAEGVHVETGRFGARTDVELVNDGPVTIVLDV